jgi:predicted nucleotidyltransferase
MKLLLERVRQEAEANERLRQEVLGTLRSAIERWAPGCVIWVYGSAIVPGAFNRYSDVDVAFESLPQGLSLYGMQSRLSEACGREVDVCFLNETRLKLKIQTEGERWIA